MVYIRFVNLMEGQIWIESEGLGKGATAIFIVKLGIAERLNESKLPFVPKALANHGQTNFLGLKVLVMDDNGLVLSDQFNLFIPSLSSFGVPLAFFNTR